MKRKIFTKLIIVLVLFLSFSSYSQTSENKETAAKKKERKELEKFTDEFIKELETKKDLGQISEKFFVADFKTRFGQDCKLSEVDSAIFNKLSKTERYEFNAAVFNFYYLGLMHAFGNANFRGEDDDIESDENNDIESVKNLFPSHIIGMIRNSSLLNAYFFEDDDYELEFEIKDVEELREFFKDSKNIIYAQQIFLNDLSSKQKMNSVEIINLLKKQTAWYNGEICVEDCKGFPEKTQMFTFRSYPLYFNIVRENGSLKIYHLYITALD